MLTRLCKTIFHDFRATLLLGSATILLCLFFTIAVIIPAWKEPTNGTYPSKFGYPSLMRQTGQALPVTIAAASRRIVASRIMGEGAMAGESVLAPIIPTGAIVSVHIEEGQRVKKGDLLVQLDPAKQQIRIEAARLALSTARAELERVRIGSAYQLAQERPRRTEVNASAAESDMALRSEKIRMTEDLARRGVISQKDLIDAKLAITESERQLKVAEVELGMAEQGATQSEVIALNAVELAETTLREQTRELDEYQVRAPIDGVVERVLVHAGEFNPETGRPAVVIAAGEWFEAHVAQAALNRLHLGDRAEVRLEALAGQSLSGRVKSIIPIVSRAAAGAQLARTPLAGTPEWPLTFRVRIELDPSETIPLAPGMTGFAKFAVEHEGTAVPEGAVTSLSEGAGIVQIAEAGRTVTRQVRYGASSGGWTEILDGISEGEQVIVEGHQFLAPQDRIAATRARVANAGR